MTEVSEAGAKVQAVGFDPDQGPALCKALEERKEGAARGLMDMSSGRLGKVVTGLLVLVLLALPMLGAGASPLMAAPNEPCHHGVTMVAPASAVLDSEAPPCGMQQASHDMLCCSAFCPGFAGLVASGPASAPASSFMTIYSLPSLSSHLAFTPRPPSPPPRTLV